MKPFACIELAAAPIAAGLASAVPTAPVLTARLLTSAVLAATALVCPAGAWGREPRPPHRSPLDLAFSPDGEVLAVSDATADRVVLADVPTGRILREVALGGEPSGVAWSPDGRRVHVAERSEGTVAEVDLSGAVSRRFRVGPRPIGIALAPRRGLLLAACSAADALSIVDLARGEEVRRVPVVREPWYVAVAPGEAIAVVGNRLPAGDASLYSASAAVSLIDLPDAASAVHLRLPANSVNVLGIAVSPDGRWAYAVHNLGRTNMSTERVTGGWISRNALTRIDLRDPRGIITVPIDSVADGAANPWGAVLSPSGTELWISLSGVHQVGRLDIPGLEEALRVRWPEREPDGPALADGDAKGPEYVYGDAATHDLGVFTEGRFHRTDLPGSGPRGIALSPDGTLLALAMYFSGRVHILDARTARVARTVVLGAEPRTDGAETDIARRGEEIFHDARRCNQHWLSCATCHPDGRTDGLNWDLFNDGAGNPKNTRSLLHSHRTPPAMALGVRPDMESATAAGFESILFRTAPADDLRAVEAYIRSLEPVESPHRARGSRDARSGDGGLGPRGRPSDAFERGRAIFESPEAGCEACHPAPLFTDLALHDVGTRGVFPWEDRFDTPTLVELWRTAPYLHHGKAATLREVFTRFNDGDRHGATSHLSDSDLDALISYLESL